MVNIIDIIVLNYLLIQYNIFMFNRHEMLKRLCKFFSSLFIIVKFIIFTFHI